MGTPVCGSRANLNPVSILGRCNLSSEPNGVSPVGHEQPEGRAVGSFTDHRDRPRRRGSSGEIGFVSSSTPAKLGSFRLRDRRNWVRFVFDAWRNWVRFVFDHRTAGGLGCRIWGELPVHLAQSEYFWVRFADWAGRAGRRLESSPHRDWVRFATTCDPIGHPSSAARTRETWRVLADGSAFLGVGGRLQIAVLGRWPGWENACPLEIISTRRGFRSRIPGGKTR